MYDAGLLRRVGRCRNEWTFQIPDYFAGADVAASSISFAASFG
jgi:hypothetical protein